MRGWLWALCLAVGAVQAVEPVPLDAFLRPATVESVRMSPDGAQLAVITSDGQRGSISLFETQDLKPVRGWRMADGNYAHALQWIDERRFVFQTRYDLADYDYGVANFPGLYLLDASRDEPLRFRLELDEMLSVSRPENDAKGPSRLFIEGKNNQRTALFELDPDDGKRTRIAVGPKSMHGGFVIDRQGQARYFVGENWQRERVMLVRDGEDWKTLVTDHAEDEARIPQRIAADDRRVYFYSPTPEGTMGLELFDPGDNSFSWVGRDARYDVAGTLSSNDGRELLAVRYDGDRPHHRFVRPDHPDAIVYRELMRSFPGHELDFFDVSRDGRWMLLYAATDRDPGRLYLFDRTRKQARPLLAYRSDIDPERMATQRPLRFPARDGTQIDAYLWVPAGLEAKQLPLVVRPHGGPHGVRDTWGFDTEAQLIASRGYAVLTVNYRGSAGYGPAFRKHGYRQWGAAMIDDITDGVRWTIEQGMADAGRVCIYGVSYGAFAALMSAAREPDLYRCAAGLSGVYDINGMYRDDRRASAWMGNYFEEIYPQDPAERDRQSPARQAQNIRAAVLLAHGKKDTITPFSQYLSMSRALGRSGRPAEVKIVQEIEGHGFRDYDARTDFYRQLLAFFEKHIGAGRAAAKD